MAKSKTVFCCVECGADSPKWLGRCADCGAWNTLVEEIGPPAASADARRAGMAPVPIAEVVASDHAAMSTGLAEVDRVLSGGLVPGSVTLLGGEPGTGKSTLLLQVAAGMARAGGKILYASAEESPQQIRLRAERLGAVEANLWLAGVLDVATLIAEVNRLDPDLVIVDSIQTIHDTELGSASGSVGQVRHCTAQLVALAKSTDASVVLVGHVTKEGSLAGPRVLEHLVDTVLTFDGDRHHGMRFLRATKHRFGTTSELGVFEMQESGLQAVGDPSAVFLADRRPGLAGSSVVATMEGDRPLLVELQALCAPTRMATPRRSAQGVDAGRLALLLAVLQRRCGLPVDELEIYALAVGGAMVTEPAADLALCVSIASALSGVPVPADVILCAEVGLAGELRRVGHLDRRLGEAARLGFDRAIVPAGCAINTLSIGLVTAAHLGEALTELGMFPATDGAAG